MRYIALIIGLFISSLASATPVNPNTLLGCQYNLTPPVLTDGKVSALQCDANGNIIVSGTFSNPPFTFSGGNNLLTNTFGALLTSTLTFQPTAASQYIAIDGLFIADWRGTVANTNNSHNPAIVGWNTNNSATAINRLGIGIEGKCENIVGSARFTTCIGVDAQFLNTGTSSIMDNATGFQMDVPTNNGTLTKLIGLHLLDYSGLTGVTSKVGFQFDDILMPSYSRAPIYGPMGYINNIGGSNSVGELSPPISFGYVANRFYYGNVMDGTFITTTPAANTLYCSPFSIAKRQTFTKIGLRVITGQAATFARLGFYFVNNGIATNLAFDAGQVSIATSGADAEISGTYNLESGEYCAGAVFSSTTAQINAYNDFFAPFIMGMTTSTGNETFYTSTQAFGALPAVAPSTVVYSNPIANKFPFIAIWLRP